MKSTRLYGMLKEVKQTRLQGGRDNFSGPHYTWPPRFALVVAWWFFTGLLHKNRGRVEI